MGYNDLTCSKCFNYKVYASKLNLLKDIIAVIFYSSGFSDTKHLIIRFARVSGSVGHAQETPQNMEPRASVVIV
jgi:hypothetical protein